MVCVQTVPTGATQCEPADSVTHAAAGSVPAWLQQASVGVSVLIHILRLDFRSFIPNSDESLYPRLTPLGGC